MPTESSTLNNAFQKLISENELPKVVFHSIRHTSITKAEVVSTNGAGHGALADFLAENKVDAVICGGVGSPMIGRLEGYGIKAYPGVAGDADQAD